MTKKCLLSLSIALVLPFALLFAGCDNRPTTEKENKGEIKNPTIGAWSESGEEYLLDTSVDFDFSLVKVAEVHSIKFSLYDGSTLLGTRESTGKQITALLKDCAQYWDKTSETYLEVTGTRKLSCAFKTRTDMATSDYWTSSACTATNAKVPTGLVIEVVFDRNGNLEKIKAQK